MRNRDAEALARLLDGTAPSGEGSAELRALKAVGEALSATPTRADERFKGELRAMLVEQARAAHVNPRLLPRVRARATSTLERARYSTRVAAASLAAAMTFSGAGAVAVAAEHALPSDALYGVKLALDEARAAVRIDDVSQGRRHLANAEERIDEAEISAARADVTGAARALRASAESARRGAGDLIRGYQERGDAAIVQTLTTFADTQADRVRVLARTLDGEAAVAARGSLVVLERIEARLVAIGGCGECPTREAPPAGDAFDFAEIPPADEPFQPCPCDEADGDGAAASSASAEPDDRPAPADPPVEPADPPTQPGDPGGEQPDEPDDDQPVPGLPEPIGDIVNDVVKDIVEKSAEKGLDGMPTELRSELPVDLPTVVPTLPESPVPGLR